VFFLWLLLELWLFPLLLPLLFLLDATASPDIRDNAIIVTRKVLIQQQWENGT